MEQTCETCKFGPGDECNKTLCPLHQKHCIPYLWEPKDDEPETEKEK